MNSIEISPKLKAIINKELDLLKNNKEYLMFN